LIAQGDAENLKQGSVGDGERTTLLAMQAYIAGLLVGEPSQQAEQIATPASTAAEKTKDEARRSADEDMDMMML
jgi:hypothetical protein